MTKTKKRIAIGAGLVVAVAAINAVLLLTAFATVLNVASSNFTSICGKVTSEVTSLLPPLPKIPAGFGKWSAKQVEMAWQIVATGKQDKVPARGWVIAVATAMQESTLHNYGNLGDRNDHDSLGLFQQRPASGWGKPSELTTPTIAAKKFFHALTDVKGWQGMALTVAAQTVQRSAFPSAYAKWEDDARKLVEHVSGMKSIGDVAGGPPGAECIIKSISQSNPIPKLIGGWVNPVKAMVGGPFGEQRSTHMHAGVDLIAARHTPIHAAFSGVISRVRCNSSSGTCDRDGSSSVVGCGWYTEIRHNDGTTVTRYCHMVSKPLLPVGTKVSAGTLIGNVGTSGGSSGPHLHYELHLNVPKGQNASSSNAVDPVAYHKKHGVPLGKK